MYYLLLPTEPGGGIFRSYSTSRIGLILAVLLYILLHIAGLILNRQKPAFRRRFISSLSRHTGWLFMTGLAAFAYLATAFYILTAPQTGLRGAYPQMFQRLDPLFLLSAYSAFALEMTVILVYLVVSEPAQSTRQKLATLGKNFLIPGGLFIFPFLYFFPRTIPIDGVFYNVSNDFIPISYTYKAYLLDVLSQLKFPLWSPSEAAGFPFFSSPFSQAFYPFNLIQAFFYLFNGGYSVMDHQRFAVLGYSIFAVGIYFWLRQFRLSLTAVVPAVVIATVSFKMAELIRYPTGLHTAAWFPWILLSITMILKGSTSKSSIKGGALFILSLTMLITGGYLYFVYYQFFLVIPYLAVFVIPGLRRAFFPKIRQFPASGFIVLLISALIAAGINSPYLLHLVSLMNSTASRAGGDFLFSTEHAFTFLDSLGSLVFPPASQTEGWYYFGTGSLLLILLFLTSSALGIRNREDKPWYLHPWIKLFLAGWFAVISYITYGANSLLFKLLWQYMPFFSTLRTWGRLNIVLVPIIALLLSLSFEFLFHLFFRPSESTDTAVKPSRARFTTLLTAQYLLILGIQWYLFSGKIHDPYWDNLFYTFGRNPPYFIYAGAAAFLLLQIGSMIFLRSNNPCKYSSFGAFLALVCAVILLDLWHIGAFNWWGGTISIQQDTRRVFHIPDRVLPESLLFKRIDSLQPAMVSLNPTFHVGYAEDWYFNEYRQFFLDHSYEAEARGRLLGVQDGTRIFITRSINYLRIEDFLQDASRLTANYRLNYFDGDRLVLTASSPEPAYLSYIDNWDPYWQANVDGQRVDVKKLFGTFKAVRINAGTSEVVFRYRPGLFPDLVIK